MRKLLLSLITLSLVFGATAQRPRVKSTPSMLNLSTKRVAAIDETTNLQTTINPYVSRSYPQNEIEVGNTIYDLQSNGTSPSNRLEVFSDGTVGATWTRATGPAAYADRGTAYNYFNGTTWGPAPTNRVETVRSGWPAYSACGPTGECFVSHQSGTTPLTFCKRVVKGEGAWVSTTIPAPAGASGLLWARLTSSGPDNNIIHVIALTAPTANGGTVFNGQDGAIVYTRSTDAGATWSTPVVLPDMNSSNYVGFGGDSYSLNAVGNDVVILVTDNWLDLFAMVSHDNGENWEKTIIWEHPIPLWNNTPTTDTIYCPDGAGQATFDHNGKLHVVFGVNRALYTDAASWFPFVDGLAYWNEDMPTWIGGDQVNCLNPDNLYASGNLIGYMIDLNGNGQLDWIGSEIANIGLYYVSPTSMPQIVIDQYGGIYVVYTSITETYDNGSQQYRHLWLTYSLDGGTTWGDQIHLSDDIIHFLDECVFPTVAREQGDFNPNIHVIYQADAEPGLSVRGDEDTPGENVMYYLEIEKPTVGTKDINVKTKEIQVSAAYPNPFSNVTSLDVTLGKKADVSIEVYSVTGQKVMQQNYGQYPAGMFKINVNAANLNSGLYIVKVKAGQESTTTRISVL